LEHSGFAFQLGSYWNPGLPCNAYLFLKYLIVQPHSPYLIFLTVPWDSCLLLMLVIQRFCNALISSQSLKKSSDLISISLHPNSWVTHITWHGEAKSNTPIHLTSINQSFSSHSLESFDLDHLHLNTLNRNLYVSNNPSKNIIVYFVKP